MAIVIQASIETGADHVRDAEGEASQAIGFIRPEHPVLIDPVIVMVEAGRPTVLVAGDGDVVLIISLDEVDSQVRRRDGMILKMPPMSDRSFSIYILSVWTDMSLFFGAFCEETMADEGLTLFFQQLKTSICA